MVISADPNPGFRSTKGWKIQNDTALSCNPCQTCRCNVHLRLGQASRLNKSERSQHPKFLDLIPPSCPRNAPAFRELAYRYPTEKPAAHLAQHPAFRRQMATSMLSIDKRPSWLQDLLVSSYQRKFSCSALSKIKKRAAPIHRTRMVTATTRIRRSS